MIPLLIILASKYLGGGEVPPEISITSWLPSGEIVWSFEEDGKIPISPWGNTTSVYVVPASVMGLAITCNASYPVQWDFTHEHMEDDKKKRYNLRKIILSKREAKDVFDDSTFNYIAELRLSGEDNLITGNFSCVSSTDAGFRSTVYLFWKGNSPPYLLKAGENVTVQVDPKMVRRQEQDIVVPCRISDPEIQVDFFKEVNGSWQTVVPDLETKRPSFQPARGFVLNPDLEKAVGHYKCSTSAMDDDVMYVNIVERNVSDTSTDFQEFLSGNASFSYDESNRRFTCCSSSGRQPIFQIVYCDHPTMCQIKKQQMQTITNNARRHSDSSCTSATIAFQTSGIIKCIGDGVSVFREYFFPTSIGLAGLMSSYRTGRPFIVTGKPYYRWEDADPEKMMSVDVSPPTVYAGETFGVTCSASQYYFAEGIKWAIMWTNHSRLIQPDFESLIPLFSKFFVAPGISRRTITAELNMTAVTCFAPVWNSSQWVEKTVVLNILETELPRITDSFNTSHGNHETVQWDVDDVNKTLACAAEGKPEPVILWQRDGHDLLDSEFINGSSVIRFTRVTAHSGGEYSCTAVNLRGNATKIFYVVLSEPTSKLAIAGAVLAVVFVSVAVGLLLVLVRRLIAQRSSIENLKSVAFRDVLEQQRNGSVVNPSSIVTDFHPGADVDVDSISSSGFGNLVTASKAYQKF